MRCLACKRPGEWFCDQCERTYEWLRAEVEQMTEYLGEHQNESSMALSASQILEAFDKVENTTSLGKASVMKRAEELLLEVEDFYKYSPMCPICEQHKMELKPGDPIRVTCTGGCVYD